MGTKKSMERYSKVEDAQIREAIANNKGDKSKGVTVAKQVLNGRSRQSILNRLWYLENKQKPSVTVTTTITKKEKSTNVNYYEELFHTLAPHAKNKTQKKVVLSLFKKIK